MPEHELRVEVEEVREARRQGGCPEELDRVGIATPGERLQVPPEGPLVLLDLFEAEDVARIGG
jgi:hypothetical protein